MDKEPIWNEENINREKGDTTFIQCGWCEYRASGFFKYNCMLSGSCSLLNRNNKVKYNTKCKIIKLGNKDVLKIIDNKKSRINSHKYSIDDLENQISIIKNINFEDKPILTYNRNYDHFNINDEIMLYIEDKNRWMNGKVVNGYHHHDGFISIFLYEKNHNDDFLDGHGRSCSVRYPGVLLKSEYDWLVNNKDAFKDWIKLSTENNDDLCVKLTTSV